jgi:4-amino-4-deoxy-L-arabinose transferase-like glycosyltransferase
MQGRPAWQLSKVHLAAAAVILAIYFGLGLWAASRKSPVFDETGDIGAGLSYLQDGAVRANLQHPPLMKELAALPLWLAGIRLPQTDAAARMRTGNGGERQAGSELLLAAGVDKTLMLARVPMLLCSTLLGLVIFLWTAEMAGAVAALAALIIYVLDPNVMAHGYLATMDIGLAAFAVIFLYALWRYVRERGTGRLIVCGIAMGLMLGAKFSGVFLLPVAAVVLWSGMGWREAARTLLVCAAIAVVVIEVLYLSPGGLYLYQAGLEQVNQDHNPDYLVYLGGQFAHSFPGYFAAAWLLKEPLATMVLGCVGAWVAWRGKTRWFLLLPPAAVLLAHTFLADDLGVRYILPAFPFAHMLAGIGAAWMLERRWGRIAVPSLGLWLAVSVLWIYPDQLAYFNEAAGGWRAGPKWLDDSNVDWGQGLKQLREWAGGRPVQVMYFGSFPVAGYLPAAGVVGRVGERGAGLYAVSAHFVARDSELRERPPVAVVGHSIYIYEVGR